MTSCEVCQHCSNAMHPSEAVSKEGYSYHKECRKCYVCSDTNLQDAEIFRGVIFCASCAKRIFRGCATARIAKKAPRRRGTRHRRHRSPLPSRAFEQSVIERARAANSSSSTSPHSAEESKPQAAPPAGELSVSHDCYCVSDVVTQARKLINFIYFQSQNLVKGDKAGGRALCKVRSGCHYYLTCHSGREALCTVVFRWEGLVETTEACQQMLDELKCLPEPEPKPRSPPLRLKPVVPARFKGKTSSDQSSTAALGTSRRLRSARVSVRKEAVPCSDLRIAELGASTEIATMALRKNSRKKVKSESRIMPKTDEPETFSMFSNLDSAVSHTSNEEYLDSECEDYRGSKNWDGAILDHTVTSIVKLPYIYFKKKILERSSLISVIAGIETEKESGYTLQTVDVDTITVWYPSAWHVMHDLRTLGEANAAFNRPLRLNRHVQFAAAAIYDEMYGKDLPEHKSRGVPVTFEIVNLLGWKPSPDQPQPLPRGSASLSLKDLHRIDEIIKDVKEVELTEDDKK